MDWKAPENRQKLIPIQSGLHRVVDAVSTQDDLVAFVHDLVRDHSEIDDPRFISVALSIASHFSATDSAISVQTDPHNVADVSPVCPGSSATGTGSRTRASATNQTSAEVPAGLSHAEGMRLSEDWLKEVVARFSSHLLRELRETILSCGSGLEVRPRRRALGEEVLFFDQKVDRPLAFIRGERTESLELIAKARAVRESFSVFLDFAAQVRFWHVVPDGSLVSDPKFSFESDYGRLLLVLLANFGCPLPVEDVWPCIHEGEEVADLADSLRKVIGYLGQKLGISDFGRYFPLIDLPTKEKALALPLFRDGALILGDAPSPPVSKASCSLSPPTKPKTPVSIQRRGGLVRL
ncbi:MAG: hypothetical protein HONDAALG_01493 [Gammaproteobacteria bacterium]|nr:hypothetical protein [Gammaproteobacteria bacterium]